MMAAMKKRIFKRLLLLPLLAWLSVPGAQAATPVAAGEAVKAKAKEKAAEQSVPDAVFHCREGNVDVYTNRRLNKACKATQLAPVTTTVLVKPAEPQGAANALPTAGFPKVSESAQKTRDLDRRRILEEEAASEQKSLDVAKKELAAQELKAGQEEKNYQKLIERLRPFKDKVAQHERNLQALRKELAGLPK